MSENSITNWIGLLKTGDEQAARLIWERFFQRLCRYASGKLSPAARRMQDGEDVALSAIHAVCQGAADGRFRQLDDRADLWQIMMMIVARKASNANRRCAKRQEVGASDFASQGSDIHVLDRLLGSETGPDLFDALELHCDELLSKLSDKLRQVALLKLSGYSNEEIAEKRQRGVSTIERYLKMIREVWSEDANASKPEISALQADA